jgi:hypothetical protein
MSDSDAPYFSHDRWVDDMTKWSEAMSAWSANPPLRQWSSAKTTGDKLDAVFQQVADADGRVEKVHHAGGRDWIIFWSKPVLR